MSFGKGQFGRRAALGIAAGLMALAGSAHADCVPTFNQNLSRAEGAERAYRYAHREMIAQVAPAPGTAVPVVIKPATKAPKELPKGLNGPPPAEAVNKLLAPPKPDPAVPLPRADLARQSVSGDDASDSPMAGPRVYGRPEQGNNGVMGVVMGVKIPIPADRNSATSRTISGSGSTSADSSDSGR
ncbi:MAG TPA: hypothetical protein VMI56_05245 [Reyranella sp.]|nr:hypothetical protein [Reyranella sp.]